ncbi:macrophage mannose receptor 1-like, partial [Huso huso]
FHEQQCLFLGFCVSASNQIRKFLFVKTEMSWSEAQSYCREKHTDMATVRSQEEAEQLLNITGDSLSYVAWIGLYRDDTQNWQWSNSDDVIYSNWRADLFCASINSQGEWEDRVCNEKKAFMCYTELKTWTEAQQYCREHHTDLVSIKSASENEDLVKKAQGMSFWIGLFNNPWKWSHQGDSYIFHNWNTREPNNYGGNQKCVEIAVRDSRYLARGKWNDKECRMKRPFFCFDGKAPCPVCVLVQLSVFIPVCEQGLRGPNHCNSAIHSLFDLLFVFTETSNIAERYTLIEELKTWTEAQQYCREHHTDLVSIKSASENEDLVKKVQGKPFWIGLFNNPWKWSHQGDSYTFQNWNGGEPNNYGGNENCVQTAVRDSRYLARGKWNDMDCSLRLPFFCFDGKAPCPVCVLVQLSVFIPVCEQGLRGPVHLIL